MSKSYDNKLLYSDDIYLSKTRGNFVYHIEISKAAGTFLQVRLPTKSLHWALVYFSTHWIVLMYPVGVDMVSHPEQPEGPPLRSLPFIWAKFD